MPQFAVHLIVEAEGCDAVSTSIVTGNLDPKAVEAMNIKPLEKSAPVEVFCGKCNSLVGYAEAIPGGSSPRTLSCDRCPPEKPERFNIAPHPRACGKCGARVDDWPYNIAPHSCGCCVFKDKPIRSWSDAIGSLQQSKCYLCGSTEACEGGLLTCREFAGKLLCKDCHGEVVDRKRNAPERPKPAFVPPAGITKKQSWDSAVALTGHQQCPQCRKDMKRVRLFPGGGNARIFLCQPCHDSYFGETPEALPRPRCPVCGRIMAQVSWTPTTWLCPTRSH